MKTLFNLQPSGENTRSSEGDFALLPNGEILFAYSRFTESGSDHAPSNIAGIFSKDGGKTFSREPEILIYASEHNTKNIMSVSFLPLENGEVGIFFIVKCPNGNNDYVLRRTKDGRNFSPAISCIPETSSKTYYVINNGRVIRKKEGRIIFPAAFHRSALPDLSNFDERSFVVFFYSDDDGHTWQEGKGLIFPPYFAKSETGLQEPGIIELPNGSLYAYARTDLGCQYESFSLDKLKSWTPAQPTMFTSPPSPLSIRQNPFSGEYFAVWNPIPNYYGRQRANGSAGRTPLIMARCHDGMSFSSPISLEDDENLGFSYPSLFFPNENTILVSYCYGGESVGGNNLNCIKVISLNI